jgi:beta-mannosidase
MARLRVEIVETSKPAAAPVSEHSVFSGLTHAARARAEIIASPAGPRFAGDLPRSVSLAGAWQRLPLAADPERELPAEDSSDWQAVLVPDNYGREPSLSAHFGPVFYRRRLPACEKGTRLVFDAVDYLCDVWIGERHLGHHEGYFAPFAFDLDEPVVDGALLTVRVQDPFEDLDPNQPFILHAKRAIKGTLKYHDSRPAGLPGRHTPGWTPREGQSMSTGGITADLRLERSGPLRIDALFVTPLDAARGKVHIAAVFTQKSPNELGAELALEVASPAGGEPQCATLRALVPPGASRIDLEAELSDPELWWPRSHADLGRPALYTATLTASVNGASSDARSVRFGLRTAEVTGDPKHLAINGRPIFVQAVNYIPVQHFAGIDKSFYLRDFALCAGAHLNSVGVHGHIQCPPCYEAADEAGMLVFQDFALQWHYDAGSETNPGFVELASRQIAEMAYALHNHPSIVYFACHNEPTAMFVPGMQADGARDADNQILDEALEKRLCSVDTGRHVHRASGIGDDVHLYDGSLMGGSLYGVRNHESWFASEYGFWTLGPRSDRWGDVRWPPDARQMQAWLSRLSFGPSTFAFSGLPERYPSLDAWRRATEAYGAFLAKYQTEWMRIRRGNPFNAYRWHFFSDWWGWAGGGLVDVGREPKATYHALARASRPVLVATSLPHTVFEPGSELAFPIYGVNESRKSVALEVRWGWHRADRSIVIGGDDEVGKRYSVPAASPRHMVALPIDALDPAARTKDTLLADGKLTVELAPESASELATLRLKLSAEALAGGFLELCWGAERNHYHVLAAENGWFCGPGAFIVGPGVEQRLE